MATNPGGPIFPTAGNGYHANCPTLPDEVSPPYYFLVS
jgi:hypothetical protein